MATPSTSSELDIPGYCYDETTKRYYKLPPRHFAELPSFSKVIPSSKPEAVYTPTSKPSHDMSLYNLVQRRQLALSDVYYPRSHFKTVAKTLQRTAAAKAPSGVQQLQVNKAGDAVSIAFLTTKNRYMVYCGFIRGHSDKSVFNGVWEDLGSVACNPSCICKFRLNDMEWIPEMKNEQNVKQSMDELEVVSISSKIIPNVCALSISPYNMDKEYMYAVGDEYGFVTAFYRSYSARGAFTFLNGTESRRICCPVPNHTLSSIQSLAFSDEGKKLFAGTKSGIIHGWCIRNGQSQPFVELKEPKEGKVFSSVAAIHPLKDSNYIISSAYNSKLSLWDVRMGRKVLQYKGHVNNYQPCKSQLVDRDEKYVFAAGSDRSVRVWSVGDGQLLRTITPDEFSPHTDLDYLCSPPLVCYTDTMGGNGYNPALVVCNHEHLAFFTL